MLSFESLFWRMHETIDDLGSIERRIGIDEFGKLVDVVKINAMWKELEETVATAREREDSMLEEIANEHRADVEKRDKEKHWLGVQGYLLD